MLEHNSTESRVKSTLPDGILIGLLNLLDRLISVRPELKEVLQK